MDRPKVLIVQERLIQYREAPYIEISRHVDLTLGYLLRNDLKNCSIPIIKLPTVKLGPFYINRNLKKIFNQYDVVISIAHLKFPLLVCLPFIKKKYKLITWSIGVRASYTRPYNLELKPDFTGRIVGEIIHHSDAAIFYMPEPIEYWVKYRGIDRKKYFVAHNTVPVCEYDSLPDFSTRNNILFVGTLYKQKGIETLLMAYSKAKDLRPQLPKLIIVGDGPERQDIEALIQRLDLSSCVELKGAIYDEKTLMNLHLSSCLCVSPNQAGLSVLKSFGYGVPFVTKMDSITGGERSNIRSGYNGILYQKDSDLVDILVDLVDNPGKYKKMADNARFFYQTEASVSNMAQGVLDAIKYVLSSK